MYAYLLQAGVLHGTKEAIAQAKRDYRKQYKRNWKQQKRPRKELRVEITLKEYAAIKHTAATFDLRPTPYARLIVLSSLEDKAALINREPLLEILQSVSMGVMALIRQSEHPAYEHIGRAETLLLRYLKIQS